MEEEAFLVSGNSCRQTKIMSRRGSISCETEKKPHTYIFEKKVQFFVVFGIDCCFKQRYKYVLQHLSKTRQNIFWPKYVTEREKIYTVVTIL